MPDLDLIAERDAAMARKVNGERSRGRPGGRILHNAEPGREHPRLPAASRARKAVGADLAQLSERAEIRPHRRNFGLGLQLDVHV